uniref:Secreted Juvenile hormone-like protein n=1 Tax=Pristhesancus plagipennis TaxID=1955184 RepID=A0A2K8JS85_PRIPG|nr:secreted Juvenile hormone-like protein [Pristhesancus plagipennis]
MKFFLIAFFAVVAVASAGIFGDQKTVLVKNVIDTLIRQGLEVVRKMLKDHEPFQIPDIPAQHIVDKDIDFNIDLKEVKVSKASDFTVDHIENNLPGLWAKFGVSIPKMHLEGQYTISGIVEKKQVSGTGTFTVDLDSFVQSGTIYMTMVNHAVQMKQLDLDYSLKGLKTDLQGLSIEGMTKDQVEDLLNNKLFEFLQSNKKDVCDVVSRQVMIAANKIMAGKTLKELLDWLRNFIHQ